MSLSDRALLQIQMESSLIFENGRIIAINDPDRSPAPLATCALWSTGWMLRYRRDIDARKIADAEERLRQAAPTANEMWERVGGFMKPLVDCEVAIERGLTFTLPHDVAYKCDATIVNGDSDAGRELLAAYSRDGMPDHLVALGFRDTGELWAPWCAAMLDGRIVALSFAARLGARGADIGVITVPGYRGRGLAAAVTAAWSAVPALKGRALFYSLAENNRASRQVAHRLSLRQIGRSVRIVEKS